MAARLLAMALVLAWSTPALAGAEAQRLDGHTLLIPGGIEPGRQPDGNSVVIEGDDGVLVFDTGRHASVSDRILAAVRTTGKPVVAVVNSHWHLDHVSGNPRIKAAFPQAKVHASAAIDGALSGFLKNSAEQGRKALAEGKLPAATADDVRSDLATIEAGATIRPDVVEAKDRPFPLRGRRLTLHIARKAATAADLWVYDAEARRVLAGDLVTLPAPFLDTSCPAGWSAALKTIDATPFTSLVPGHGPVMTQADFRRWRGGFEAFLDCAVGDGALSTCSAAWVTAIRPLIGEAEVGMAGRMADYYGGLFRSGKLGQYCRD